MQHKIIMNDHRKDITSEPFSITWLITSVFLISFAAFKILVNILLIIPIKFIKSDSVAVPLVINADSHAEEKEKLCNITQNYDTAVKSYNDESSFNISDKASENLLPSGDINIVENTLQYLPVENVNLDNVIDSKFTVKVISQTHAKNDSEIKMCNVLSESILENLTSTIEKESNEADNCTISFNNFSESLTLKENRSGSETDLCRFSSKGYSDSVNLQSKSPTESSETDLFRLSINSNSENPPSKTVREYPEVNKCQTISKSDEEKFISEMERISNSNSRNIPSITVKESPETNNCQTSVKSDRTKLPLKIEKLSSAETDAIIPTSNSNPESLPPKTKRNICGPSCCQLNQSSGTAYNDSSLKSKSLLPHSSFLKNSLINQKGYLCTVLNNKPKFIFSFIENAPILITIDTKNKQVIGVDEKNSNAVISNSISFNFVWTCEKVISTNFLPDGFEVLFDAMLIPGTKRYQASLIWNGFKPSHIPLPLIRNYGFLISYINVPAWIMFIDSEYLYINIYIDNAFQKSLYTVKSFCSENTECSIENLKFLKIGTALIAEISKFFSFGMNATEFLYYCSSLSFMCRQNQRNIKPPVYSSSKVYELSSYCMVESNFCTLFADVDFFLECINDVIVIKAHVSSLYLELEAKLERHSCITGHSIPYFKDIMFAKGSILKTVLPVGGEVEWSILMMKNDTEEWINVIRDLQLSQSNNKMDIQPSQKTKKRKKRKKRKSDGSEISSCGDNCSEKELSSNNESLQHEPLENSSLSEYGNQTNKERNTSILHYKLYGSKGNTSECFNVENSELKNTMKDEPDDLLDFIKHCHSSAPNVDSDLQSTVDNAIYFSKPFKESIMVPLPVSPTSDRTSQSTKKYKAGKIKSVVEDSIKIENKIAARSKCFLFGISIYSIDLKKILKVGQVVEYELDEDNIDVIKQCWIGCPVDSPEERYQTINEWCRNNTISKKIRCYLLDKTDYVPDSSAPLVKQNVSAQIVSVGETEANGIDFKNLK